MKQPPTCNAFIAPGCEPFQQCRYGVDDLSGINKKELVNIICHFHECYECQPAAHWRRKIHAMQKVLKILGLHEDKSTRESLKKEEL